MPDEIRGSEQLLARLGEQKVLPKETLDQLVNLTRKRGVKLVQWWIRGQPRPDFLQGAFLASPVSAGGLITELIRLERLRLRLDVFPYGIPVPDQVLVKFENVDALGG